MSPTPNRPFTPFSAGLTNSLDQISKTIDENAKMIDLIQEVALNLTTSISTLHALTGKYAGTATGVLDTLLPILRSLPIIPDNVMEPLNDMEALTRKIVGIQASTARTLADVQAGLTNGDVSKLRGQAAELQKLSHSLAAILPK